MAMEVTKQARGRIRKKVFVGNAGVSGHYSPNHEYLIKNYSFSPKFSWIVVLCGINDMGRVLKGDDEFMGMSSSKYLMKNMPLRDALV